MTTSDDVKDRYTTHDKNVIAKIPIFFYRNGKQAFVPLEEGIIDELRLTRQDLFTQEITSEGILLRRFKEDI